MTIREFQELIKEIYFKRDAARGKERTALWLVEEVGELAEAVRKNGNVGEEIADIIAWALSVANLCGVDVEEEVMKKYPGYCIRCGKKPCRCDE